MNGHLFILRGDLTQLSCDAWLLPTDEEFTIEPGWLKFLPGRRPHLPDKWPDGQRSLRWKGWPAHLPQPWLTNTGAGPASVEWFVSGAVEFVQQAAQTSGKPRANRERPLLGLPLVGTGRGGAHLVKGGIVSLLIPELQKILKKLNVDAVLVVNTPAALAACQAARPHNSWPELSLEEDNLAKTLADHAKSDHLALFFGAGVSVGSGMPAWRDLLDELFRSEKLEDSYRIALEQLNEVDQAQVLALRNQGTRFRKQVVKIITRVKHYSLVHGLLAGLPHREAVTPNYDGLFELASVASGQPVSILPYQPKRKGWRWLLKMHGDVQQAQDIVLTREDFLRYRTQRAALAGVVQALLLTRHLLVVGFSLRDENFISIVDEVRRAIPRGCERDPMGTALLFEPADPLRDLWSRDISIASLKSARRLEIFLDRVLACSSESTHHLLDESFATFLKKPELILRDQLRKLDDLPQEIRQLPAWKEVEKLLNQLGKNS